MEFALHFGSRFGLSGARPKPLTVPENPNPTNLNTGLGLLDGLLARQASRFSGFAACDYGPLSPNPETLAPMQAAAGIYIASFRTFRGSHGRGRSVGQMNSRRKCWPDAVMVVHKLGAG